MSTMEDKVYGIKRKGIHYKDKNCVKELTNHIYDLINQSKKQYKEIIILCIGTDRVAGDCFGPMLGTFLSKRNSLKDKCKIIGTLQNPVHALNLIDTVNSIDTENSLIIAVDASLGKSENVGNLRATNGALSPGSGVNKDLPRAGDISIAGIVNTSCGDNFTKLQNTSIGSIYDMVQKLELSLNKAINKLSKNKVIEKEFKKVI